MPTATRVCLYLRMSSDGQDKSIASQRAALKKYATEKGYKIVGEYVDEGISGDATERRAGFLRMVADAPARKFDLILCWDQDRFGRFDPIEGGYWIKPIRDAGIALETIADGRVDWNSLASRLTWAVKQEGKRAYLDDISRNTLRGKADSIRAGRWASSKTPYGFTRKDARGANGKRIDGRLYVDDSKAHIVCQIFDQIDAGQTLRQVAMWLNDRGIKSPGGGLWHRSTVAAMISNPAYIGHTVWNRRRQGKYSSIVNGSLAPAGGRTRCREPDQWIVVENTHDGIISIEQFDRVQVKLSSNKGRTSPTSDPGYILKGLLVCGHCGSRMSGSCLKYKSHPYYHFVCSGYSTSGKCLRYSVDQAKILPDIIADAKEKLADPKLAKRIEDAYRRQYQAKSISHELDAAERRLKSLEEKVEQAVVRLTECDMDLLEIVQNRLRKLRTERDAAKAHRDSIAASTRTDSQIRQMVKQAVGLWKGAGNLLASSAPEDIREALVSLIRRVVLKFSRIPRKTMFDCIVEDIRIEYIESIVSR